MKVLIVDDSRLARLELYQQLEKLLPTAELSEAEDIQSAKKQLLNDCIDLVFLDIEMPGGSGFELLEECPNHPQVIFVTAYDQYAIQSFDVGATDYLLKPVREERLKQALDKLPKTLGDSQRLSPDSKIFIKDGKQCSFTSLNDVYAFESVGNYIKVHLQSSAPMIYKSLTDLEQRLPDHLFFRASRSWIVNVDKITDVQVSEQNSLDIRLDNRICIDVSRRQAAKFKQLWSL